MKLSQSNIKDFIKCPRKYQLSFEKFEEGETSKEAQIGTIVHKVIELHWRETLETQVKETLKLLFEANIDDIDRAVTCIHNFNSLGLSKSFSEDDLIEFYFREDIKGVTFSGRIDRIVKSTNSLYDWKTGNVRVKQLSNDPQFIIYYEVYRRIFGTAPNVFLVDLFKGQQIFYQPEPVYIDALFGEVVPDIINRINNQDFPRQGYFNGSCFMCPYRSVC